MKLLCLLGIIAVIAACSNAPVNETQTKPENPPVGPTATVLLLHKLLITNRDLPAEITITSDMITVCIWGPGSIPELSLTRLSDVVGRKTRVAIPKGTPILATQLLGEILTNDSTVTLPTTAFSCASTASRANVIVANKEIVQGQTISKDSLVTETWPLEAVPASAITDIQSAIGKTASSLIPKGMLLLETQISEQ